MSRNHFNELSPCEALIMKLIWEAPQDIPVQELIDQLRDDYGKDYARTTVVTFVGKLKDKRFVDTYRKGKAAFIHPLRSEEEYRRQLLKEEADFWFNGKAVDMVASICESQKLEDDEVRELRRFLMVLINNNFISKSNKKHHLIRKSDSSGDVFCYAYII